MYEIIFNSMTTESLKKFLKISKDGEIKQNQKKEAIIEDIKIKLESDKKFKKDFITYFKQIEKAGRKDFWFQNLVIDLNKNDLQKLRNKIKAIPKEQEEIYIPHSEQDLKYFNVSTNNNLIEFKVIRKKIIKEKDESKTHTEGDYLYVAYKQTEIRHVSYYRLDLSKNNKLLVGVDVWQNLSTKEKLKEVKVDVDQIFGSDFWPRLKYVDLKKSANNLFDSGNSIIKELKDKVLNSNEGVSFSIETENIKIIKKALNDKSVKLENIKTKFITDDVRNNQVFQAAQGKSINLTHKGGKGAFFYYSDGMEEYDYFRFEVFATESRIKLLNDHTMFEDLKDVFSKII